MESYFETKLIKYVSVNENHRSEIRLSNQVVNKITERDVICFTFVWSRVPCVNLFAGVAWSRVGDIADSVDLRRADLASNVLGQRVTEAALNIPSDSRPQSKNDSCHLSRPL